MASHLPTASLCLIDDFIGFFFNDCTLLEAKTNEGTGPFSVSAKLRPNQQVQIAQATVSLKFQCQSCTSPAAVCDFSGSHDATSSLGAAVLTEDFSIVVRGVTGVAK